MSTLQVGNVSFREIRENDYCYVDKTGFIEEFFSLAIKLSLITRPRRFGKTLMMNMLSDFFDITKDSKAIFDGLTISKNKELCDKWMNQYPVVFLSFKDIEGLNFEEALGKVRSCISDVSNSFPFLTDSKTVREIDRLDLETLNLKKADKTLLSDSLKILCRALHAYYGKPVILLIDEYDVPLAKAYTYGYYPEMVQFIGNMLSGALKDYTIIQFGILTGCLRISGESIFTGLNNFKCFGISNVRYADKFGFTSKEVDELLAQAGFSEKKQEIKEWYDGYRFGKDTEIYCPWDILQYVTDLQDDPEALPLPYWQNSTQKDIVRTFVDQCNTGDVKNKLDTLMSGGCIGTRLIENITYDRLYESAENMWTVLYLSGYLTKAGPAQMEKNGIKPDGQLTVLAIPNKEVLEIFATAISQWFDNTVQKKDRTELFKAFWADDTDAVTALLCDEMEDSLSYYDAREDFYHALILGLFTFTEWEVESNREYGNGRPDIILRDTKNKRAAVIETKRTTSEDKLADKAEEAIQQIKTNRYAAPLIRRKGWKVSLWGMAFFKKNCVLKTEEGRLNS